MQCPLCNYHFDDRQACTGCGFSKGCTMIKCPNCQYEFVEESKMVNWFSKTIQVITNSARVLAGSGLFRPDKRSKRL